MIDDVFARVGRRDAAARHRVCPDAHDHGAIARAITLLEGGGSGGRAPTPTICGG